MKTQPRLKLSFFVETHPATDEHVSEPVFGLFWRELCLIGIGLNIFRRQRGGMIYLICCNYFAGALLAEE